MVERKKRNEDEEVVIIIESEIVEMVFTTRVSDLQDLSVS